MSQAILCLDSSGTLCSVSVTTPDSTVFASSAPGEKHTEVIIGLIRKAMVDAGVKIEDLKAVCFANGPGAFTGIRVACGLAQGIGWSRSIPLIPVGSLEALALAQSPNMTNGSLLLAAVDARMHECYFAIYAREDNELKEVSAPKLCKPEEIESIVKEVGCSYLCGNAFRIYSAEIGQVENAQLLSDEDINASMLEKPAWQRFKNKQFISAEDASPLYVRNHVALTIEERKNGESL